MTSMLRRLTFFFLAVAISLGASPAVRAADYPEEIAAAVPAYPGAQILAMQREAGTVQVIMTVNDDPAKAMAFYKKEIKSGAWSVEQEIAAGPVNGLTALKDGMRLIVSVMADAGQDSTLITLTLEKQ